MLIRLRISPALTPTDKAVLIVIIYLPHYSLKIHWVPSFISFLLTQDFFFTLDVAPIPFALNLKHFLLQYSCSAGFYRLLAIKKNLEVYGENNCQHYAFALSQSRRLLGDLQQHGYLAGYLIWLYATEPKVSSGNRGRTDFDETETRPESSRLTLRFNLADCQSEVKLDKEDGAGRAAQERSPAQWADD